MQCRARDIECALCIKASCIVLVEASRVPGDGEEEVLLMRRGRTAEEGLIEAAGKVPQSTDAAVSGSKDEPPGPPRAAPAQVPSASHDLEAWGKTTRCPVSVSQTLSGQRRTVSSRDCRPPSTSAEAQSRADEAEAVLWDSAQHLNSRTVEPNISLNAKPILLRMDIETIYRQSRTIYANVR